MHCVPALRCTHQWFRFLSTNRNSTTFKLKSGKSTVTDAVSPVCISITRDTSTIQLVQRTIQGHKSKPMCQQFWFKRTGGSRDLQLLHWQVLWRIYNKYERNVHNAIEPCETVTVLPHDFRNFLQVASSVESKRYISNVSLRTVRIFLHILLWQEAKNFQKA